MPPDPTTDERPRNPDLAAAARALSALRAEMSARADALLAEVRGNREAVIGAFTRLERAIELQTAATEGRTALLRTQLSVVVAVLQHGWVRHVTLLGLGLALGFATGLSVAGLTVAGVSPADLVRP